MPIAQRPRSPREMVQSDIHEFSIRLITIVNDFLDYLRLEQGRDWSEADQFSAADPSPIKSIAEFGAGGGIPPKIKASCCRRAGGWPTTTTSKQVGAPTSSAMPSNLPMLAP